MSEITGNEDVYGGCGGMVCEKGLEWSSVKDGKDGVWLIGK